MSSFNPRNHGTLSFRRKERPCLKSEFLDVAPSRAALVRAETHGTMSNRVSWEVRSGRFGLDAKLNKPPPQSQTRVWTSPHCPRAAPEQPRVGERLRALRAPPRALRRRVLQEVAARHRDRVAVLVRAPAPPRSCANL